jgi:acetylornithine/succinyldiaminopimelate/putrescine aminotransferase
MVGIVLNHPGAPVIKECLNRGLLLNCTMGNVLRLLPPLVVTREECDQAVDILCEVLAMDEIRSSGENQ